MNKIFNNTSNDISYNICNNISIDTPTLGNTSMNISNNNHIHRVIASYITLSSHHEVLKESIFSLHT